jgi:hypothetical protein
MGGLGGVEPRILNFGMKIDGQLRGSATLPLGNNRQYLFQRRLDGPQNRVWRF